MIVVGTKLQLKFLHFFKTNDVMVEPMCELLHQWMQTGKKTHKLHMDNAGENKEIGIKIKKRCMEKPSGN